MKKYSILILKTLIILLIAHFIGFTLLVISYKLPAKRMEKNLAKSIDIFTKEETYEKEMFNYAGSRLDNFTDAIMLQNATYCGKERTLFKSVYVYRYYNSTVPKESLVMQVKDKKNPEVNKKSLNYSRYWHGYLIILKPLLLFFSYNDIRVLNSILQPILIVGIVYLLTKKDKGKYIVPYILSILLISPNTIAKSIQFSVIFYIFNISLLLMLLFNEQMKAKKLFPYFFLLIGIATSYFDFLTYPIATYGMPIILYFILNNKNSLKNNFIDLVILSIMWGVGYIGMWFGKLSLGSIIVRENLFKAAFDAFQIRTSLETTKEIITIKDVLLGNLEKLNYPPFILMGIIILIVLIILIIKNKSKINKNTILSAIPILLVSFVPFVWYVFASNHSYVHSWFTYRTMIVTLFGFISFLFLLFDNNGGLKNEKRHFKRKQKNSSVDSLL